MNLTKFPKAFLLIVFVLLILSACSFGPEPLATDEPLIETQGPRGDRLPHSIFFLSEDPEGEFQVWYIDVEGSNPFQVTNETGGVTDFDVSTSDGRVAYITNNQLYLVQSDGSGRILLVDGGQVEDQDRVFQFTQQLSGVSWTSSGGLLAYGLNGIHLYSIDQQSDIHLIENIIEQLDGGQLHPVALYSPVYWSPDDNYLLVDIGLFEL